MRLLRVCVFLSALLLFGATAIAQNSAPSPMSNEPTERQKFDLSLEMLKGYRADLQDRLEKSSALLIVVIGWLITSETARKSLAHNALLFWGGAITLTLLVVMYCLTIYHFMQRFLEIQVKIDALAFIDPAYFSRYRMPATVFALPTYFSYALPVLFLYIFALLILRNIKRGRMA